MFEKGFWLPHNRLYGTSIPSQLHTLTGYPKAPPFSRLASSHTSGDLLFIFYFQHDATCIVVRTTHRYCGQTLIVRTIKILVLEGLNERGKPIDDPPKHAVQHY